MNRLKEVLVKLKPEELKKLIDEAIAEQGKEKDPYEVPSDPLERERFYDEML